MLSLNFYSLRRWLRESQRTPVWNAANYDYRTLHTTCEMCGLPAGKLGYLDGPIGVQARLEVHDIKPYHTLTEEQRNDYHWLIEENFIILHHFEHFHEAHLGDPRCLKFNPNIRQLAEYVKNFDTN